MHVLALGKLQPVFHKVVYWVRPCICSAIYTANIPKYQGTKIATFADETSILAIGINTRYATDKLQRAVNKIMDWAKRWRIKLNESKSQHINFTNRQKLPLPITLNQQRIPYVNTAKYLGITLDVKLRWKEHILIKIKQLKIIKRKLYWMIGRQSKLSIYNILMLYKQIMKPVWTYGIQL